MFTKPIRLTKFLNYSQTIFLYIGIYWGLFSSLGNAQNISEITKIIASDGEVGHLFGISVDIHETILIVGAEQANGGQGAAYIFYQDPNDKGKWVEEKRLTIEGSVAFGAAVAITRDFVIIGAPEENGRAGVTYIFAKDEGGEDNWGLIDNLEATSPTANDQFGISVAITPNFAMVGATGKSSRRGAAYIFQNNNGSWSRIEEITNPVSDNSDAFGGTVAISFNGQFALIGAENKTQNGFTNQGVVYSYETQDRVTWSLDNTLTDENPNSGERFGIDITVENDLLLIGTKGKDEGNGGAFIYRRDANEWDLEKFLIPENDILTTADNFGTSVDLSGNIAVIGAPFRDGIGAAYIFSRNKGGARQWGEVGKLVAQQRNPNRFGISVSIDGDFIVVGANEDNVLGENSGAAYVLPTGVPTPNINGLTRVCVTSSDSYGTNCVPTNSYTWQILTKDTSQTIPDIDTNAIDINWTITDTVQLILGERFTVPMYDTIVYDTLEVVINPLPEIDLSNNPDTICTNNLPFNFTTIPSGGSISVNGNFNANPLPLDTNVNNSIQYIFTDANGCTSVANRRIFMFRAIDSISVQSPANSRALCLDDNLILEAIIHPMEAIYDSLVWFFVTKEERIDTGFTVAISDTGTYQVRAYSRCGEFLSPVFKVLEADIWLPSLFTPNGDSLNDRFILRSTSPQDIIEVNMKILNRFHEIIYQTNDVQEAILHGWDGGENPEDTYIYTAQVVFGRCEETKTLTGRITLKR